MRTQHPSNSPNPHDRTAAVFLPRKTRGRSPAADWKVRLGANWPVILLKRGVNATGSRSPPKDMRLPKCGSEKAREGNAIGSRNPEPVNFKTISLSEWHHQSCGTSWHACLPPCRCIGGWPAHDCSKWPSKSDVPQDHGHWSERPGSLPTGGPKSNCSSRGAATGSTRL